jgi:hypothetical protein
MLKHIVPYKSIFSVFMDTHYKQAMGQTLLTDDHWYVVVCLCAHFQTSPRSSHWTTVQRIFRYYKHTPEFEIWYSAASSLDLIVFFDADFMGCRIDQKNTSGTCHFLNLLLFIGQLISSLLLHSPPQRPSM